jgi:hypothetical protein
MHEVIAQQGRLAAIETPATATQAEAVRVRTAVDVAFVYGFRWVMLLSATLALASSYSAWLLIGSRRQSRSP